jgi:capsid protein
MLRSLAAGVGLPAWKVSADLSDVNFSSARLGDHAWRRRVAALQKLIEGQFLNRVFRRFVALEVAAGRLKVDLRNLPEPRWLWPAWPMVDPLAETQADALAVENCFTSVTAVIAARGRDPQEVRAEIAAEVSSRPVSTPALKVVEK